MYSNVDLTLCVVVGRARTTCGENNVRILKKARKLRGEWNGVEGYNHASLAPFSRSFIIRSRVSKPNTPGLSCSKGGWHYRLDESLSSE